MTQQKKTQQSPFRERLNKWRGRRVKTPTVLQMEAVECGAAALAIMMEKYGRIVPLEELRIACGVSRNGSKASNMLRAARDYGFTANGFRRTVDKVKLMELPAIIFWNFNHFLVVEGFRGDKVYLNDPATGPRVVTEEEFDSSFTGVVITIQPGPDFKKGGKRPSLVQALRQRLGSSVEPLSYVLLVSLCLTILGLVVPAFTRIFVDQYLVSQIDTLMTPLLIAMGITLVLVFLLTWLQKHYLLRLESKLALATSARFFWHILRLPIAFFDQRRVADISIRVGINDRIAMLLSGDLATNVLNLVLIVFYFVVMVRYDVLLAFTGLFVATFNILALRYLSRKRVDVSQRMQGAEGKLTATAFGGLQMIETLKATGRESDFFARWSGFQAKATNAEQELGVSMQILAVMPPVLLAINTAVILTIGGLRVIDGQLSAGDLLAFQALLTSFLLPVNQMVTLGDKLQETRADLIRIDDVLRYPVDKFTEQDDGIQEIDGNATKLTGVLELRNVTFGYSRLEPPLIENFSLVCKPGMRVALIGGSGSGKSTVTKLVAGLYEPWSGEILFDGKPRQELSRTQLKNSLAVVDQDIHLFEGAVRRNITMWDDNVPDSHTIQAAKDAAIHDEVSSRIGSYDSTIAENGSNFSGGQRQRLEIARALAHNPSILLMDEATSALDPITEKNIDDNLRKRGCTCLIVAHRLSTIRDCDEIIVLDKGKVVQRGSHQAMSRVDGPYMNLIRADDSSRPERDSIFDLLTI